MCSLPCCSPRFLTVSSPCFFPMFSSPRPFTSLHVVSSPCLLAWPLHRVSDLFSSPVLLTMHLYHVISSLSLHRTSSPLTCLCTVPLHLHLVSSPCLFTLHPHLVVLPNPFVLSLHPVSSPCPIGSICTLSLRPDSSPSLFSSRLNTLSLRLAPSPWALHLALRLATPICLHLVSPPHLLISSSPHLVPSPGPTIVPPLLVSSPHLIALSLRPPRLVSSPLTLSVHLISPHCLFSLPLRIVHSP